MPTLGVDLKVTLTTGNTKSSLAAVYRGIKVGNVVLRPIKVLENGADVYDIADTNIVVFISDVYDGTNPFDLTFVTSDLDAETGENTVVNLTAAGLCILNTTNLIQVTVTNCSQNPCGYQLIS